MSEEVTVRFFAAARAAASVDEVRIAPGALAEIIAQLTAQYPELGRVTPACSFLVNGVHATEDAAVPAGATLDVLPPFAGG